VPSIPLITRFSDLSTDSDLESNYIGNASIMSNAAKSFDILAISLVTVLHNYLISQQNYFQTYLNF